MRFLFSILVGYCAVTGCGKDNKPATPAAGAPSLSQERLLFQQAGYPTTVRTLQKPSPPPEQDAAPLYVRVSALFRAPLPPNRWHTSEPSAFLYSTYLPSKAELKDGLDCLSLHHAELTLIKAAAKRPSCVFVRNWRMPNPDAMDYPEFPAMRHAGRLLSVESQVLALQHRYDEAVADLELGLRIPKHAGTERLLLAYFAQRGIEVYIFEAARKILWLSDGDGRVASRIRRTIESEWRPPQFATAAALDGAFQADMIELFRGGDRPALEHYLRGDSEESNAIASRLLKLDDWDWRGIFDESEALALNRSRRVAAVVDKPYLDALAGLRQVAAEIEGDKEERHYLLRMMSGDPMVYATKKAQEEAEYQVMRSAAAVLEWRGTHSGKYPASLEEALKPAPIDPFDGKPLRYRRQGSGFVIYSIGKTGTFDGGTSAVAPSVTEAVFRFPRPEYVKLGAPPRLPPLPGDSTLGFSGGAMMGK